MIRKLPISALCLVMLAGCATDQRPAGFTATLPQAPAAAPVQANGAIFNASTGYAPLHFGQRAHRVGDLVTVVLLERTTTSKSADSSQARDGSIALRPPTVGPFAFDPNVLNSGGSSSFNGGGDASQTSSLRGDLTVTIAEVRPNGTALVKGEKVMQFSQGEEWVQLAGIIRLADIDQDNRIASQRVADAQITYAGKGAVQRASREGWLSRFFNTVTPF
ncbi:MAG: flagellar basal body L-ring protein FlgH [Porphyrobacter sp.]|nr:flagellar basal body L-ring protein FlgH [Porphyrobacter sp.]